ncbi:MAG: phytoene desaturase family protein [Sandaracinaceae bacterium]
MKRYDVAVIGAGFGGLATALSLAERGAKVVVSERLNYPGGCASTFTRGGARFESGATLFSGLGPGQLFETWVRRHNLDVSWSTLDPVVELRTPGWSLEVPSDRHAWVERMASLDPARADGVRGFFALQGKVADALWALLSDPAMLPPLSPGALLRHASRVPAYLPILPWISKPLEAALRHHGLADFEPMRVFADAVSQITVQASAAEAEAPFAMSTMDYFFRGTGHIEGGIGALAWGLVRAIENLGGEVRLADAVKGMRQDEWGWCLNTRRGAIHADTVVANLLPQTACALSGITPRGRMKRLAKQVESGWGAVMLYLVIDPAACPREAPFHLELVQDPNAPFVEGNHLFVSVSGAGEARAPDGRRTATVSTHVAMDRVSPERVASIQAHMRKGLASLAPVLHAGIEREMTASPRTFERFTGRHRGFVGGVPRRFGLDGYRDLWPSPVAPNLYLVGDTVFPGQSTLATALGGQRLAEHLAAL